MPYKGQPVPSTIYNAYRAKVGDGKSVNVPVPEKTTIEAGLFYEISGFFGSAMQSVKTLTGETSEVVLNIEQAEYETNQIEKHNHLSLVQKFILIKVNSLKQKVIRLALRVQLHKAKMLMALFGSS